MNCTIYVAKTKALISFAVTAKLICVFVFAYAKCWFSRDAAHIFFCSVQYSGDSLIFSEVDPGGGQLECLRVGACPGITGTFPRAV